MITAGYIWSEVSAALRLHGADDMLAIQQASNLAYQYLCGRRSWEQLRRKVTINFTGHDSANSMTLPGDIAGIDAIWESDHDHEYVASDWAASENSTEYSDDRNYRFFLTEPEADTFAILTGVLLQQSANIFSCDNWLDAYIGEYVTIGSELGVYKLTAANTISPRWYGPLLTGGPQGIIQVRPAGTKHFSIVDWEGIFMENSSVVLYYHVFPSPLYQNFQPILLPSSRCLELLTIINVLGLRDRKESLVDRYRLEYEREYAIMCDLNAEFQKPSIPVNRFGEQLSFTGR